MTISAIKLTHSNWVTIDVGEKSTELSRFPFTDAGLNIQNLGENCKKLDRRKFGFITINNLIASYCPETGTTFITFDESNRKIIEEEIDETQEIIAFGDAKEFKVFFEVEQSVNGGETWEPLDNGAFDTQPQAIAAMWDLEINLGWRGLRIVQVIETDQEHWSDDVVVTGLEQ